MTASPRSLLGAAVGRRARRARRWRSSARAAAGPQRQPGPTAPRRRAGRYAARPGGRAARQALIVDFDTGAVLLEKNADERMPPSSMSKLMTMYVVFEQLKAGRLQLDQKLPVSERAWRMGGSKMFVQIGTQVKVEDLIRGVIVQSGNDACIVLAEAISGSEQQFAELMNETGRRIGLQQQQFPQLDRLARPRAPHDGARPGDPGAAHHQRLPGILPLLQRAQLPLQQHQPGQPQPAAGPRAPAPMGSRPAIPRKRATA